MPMFRKIPRVIEARMLGVTGTGWETIAEWCGGMLCPCAISHDERYSSCAPGVAIKTLEGTVFAMAGDWVIKGVAGEFYPCKPDIFEATYEPATPSTEG